MARKAVYHMEEPQISLALELLEERDRIISLIGDPGEYSFEKIAQQVGRVTGEAIRQLTLRDMSPSAQHDRKMNKLRSAALLNESDEVVAAGWIVCHDMLRLRTAVESFCEYVCTKNTSKFCSSKNKNMIKSI